MFDTGVDGVKLCLHIGVGCGNVMILQVGGVIPPETKIERYEYIIAGPPIDQISIAEPLAKNGETCVSPEAWFYVSECILEGRILDSHPDYHILGRMDVKKYTFPTVRQAAIDRDMRDQHRFRLSELPILRRYIPSAVFKQIEGGTLTYVNEMRNISTIFIAGSGIDVSTDAGSRVAQELMSEIQRCCYAHEGTLNKYLVDDKGMLFLLVYGLPPMVHTDDATRAILACFDMTVVFKTLGLVGRFGITTGRNYCGVVGSARRMEYTVLGDTVNLAARLMGNAAPLSILCDSATRKLAQRNVTFTALSPIRVKGKSNLIPIFEPRPMQYDGDIGLSKATGAIGFPWKCECAFLGGKSKLTECKLWADMAKMQEMFTQSEQGRSGIFSDGGILVLSGDIGMGKKELTEYVVTEALQRYGALPIFGTAGARPGERFRPIHELLKSIVLTFRHEHPSLPESEQEALMKLVDAEFEHFVSDLQPDLSLTKPIGMAFGVVDCPHEARICSEGIDLVHSLMKKLGQKKPLLCVLSLQEGSNIFASERSDEDKDVFWNLAVKLSEMAGKGMGLPHPLLLMVVTKYTKSDYPDSAQVLLKRSAYIELTPLSDSGVLEYMSRYLRLPEEKLPDPLHQYVAKITCGNPLFVRETIDSLLHCGHINVAKNQQGNPDSLLYTKDLESINIADWASTDMVGGTICLLESLEPLQSAIVKMTTVFRGVFTVADLAASSCSRWAGATYFDAFRVFYAVVVLVDRGIIDRAAGDVVGAAGDQEIDIFKLNNVLIRKVGDSMILEAQKKAVKRQALMERVLAKDLPLRMEELRRRKAIPHVPWYYQIDHPEAKTLIKGHTNSLFGQGAKTDMSLQQHHSSFSAGSTGLRRWISTRTMRVKSERRGADEHLLQSPE